MSNRNENGAEKLWADVLAENAQIQGRAQAPQEETRRVELRGHPQEGTRRVELRMMACTRATGGR
jgi:hypothetical protein